MKYLFPFLFLILFLMNSCDRAKKTEANEETIDSLVINTKRITNRISETLVSSAQKDLEEWEEYNDVDEFIISYYNISASDALAKADELSSLVKRMKDTIRVPMLDKPNVIARFNVLHNETLRLADMANISSITDEEVTEEVTQMLEVYAAVNSKINTIYKANDLQKSLEVDTETPVEIIEEEEQDISKTIRRNRAKSNKEKSKIIKQ